MDSITVELYALPSGKEPYTEWKRRLSKDTLAVITARIARLRNGNFGTCKPVGGGVYELKIYHGPGYRIYYGKKGETLVVLLCAGNKSTQSADIERAREYWKDCLRNKTRRKA